MKFVKEFFKEILVGVLLLASVFVWFVVARETRAGTLQVSLLDVSPSTSGSAVFIDGPGGIQVLIESELSVSAEGKLISQLSRVMPFYDRSIDLVIGANGNENEIKSRYDILLPDYIPQSGQKISLGSGATLTITSLAPITAKLEYGKSVLTLTGVYPIEIDNKSYNPNFAGTVIAHTDGTGLFSVNVEGNEKSYALESDKIESLLATAVEPLEVRAKESGCHITGPYPDHECSPGAIFPNVTMSEICVSGYTKRVRNVSASLKRKVYTEYGLSYPQKTGTYEADHIIPLELGGSNDIANLFPESAEPTPGFKEKDIVENYLHQEVCAGRADLSEAQKQIASDWLAVYQALTPEQIKVLKNQYRSWSQ